uniref:Uncharacterized protein n=1 Tax=Astyanax mexicanus TaxID=7994 RepID=A0A3B1IH40_ASTMX
DLIIKHSGSTPLCLLTRLPLSVPRLSRSESSVNTELEQVGVAMEEYDVRSAASILASVKEQEARFERLTRALEEERRNVTLQLDHANLPCGDRLYLRWPIASCSPI